MLNLSSFAVNIEDITNKIYATTFNFFFPRSHKVMKISNKSLCLAYFSIVNHENIIFPNLVPA